MNRYYLQNRYQDSGWELLDNENFYQERDAVARAAELSKNAICYGMVRVIDRIAGTVIKTFAAGGSDA